VLPLLMLGGAYLCYEGAEKLLHKFTGAAAEDAPRHARQVEALADPAVDMVAFERDKIKGAIRTDFVLSAEILVITLGTVASVSFAMQVAVMVGIAILMTVGVYGLVAAIVKLDDGGLYLSRRDTRLLRSIGYGILWIAPQIMKALSIIGTAAMFLVGGGILVHGIPGAHEWLHHWLAGTGAILEAVLPIVVDALAGVLAGVIVLAGIAFGGTLFGAKQKA
jgi:uncharacterized protein